MRSPDCVAVGDGLRGKGVWSVWTSWGLFTAAFGVDRAVAWPWRVAHIELDARQTQLDLHLMFDRGSRFPCPAAGYALEGINSPGQAAKVPTRGYRNKDKMINIIYCHEICSPLLRGSETALSCTDAGAARK